MSRRPRALFLVNPRSARGRAEIGAGITLLREYGLEVDVRQMDTAETVAVSVRELAPRYDLLIVGGGDGTLNLLADVAVEVALPLGILPMGTANDLARGLGIPDDPVEACRIIATGNLHRIDLGWVNGKHFFNVASLGASVEIARTMQKRRDRNARWGALSYPIAMVEAASRCRPFRARVRVDGHEQDVHSYQISVGNGLFYGGGMRVAEEATLDDQALDLYSLKVRPAWQVALHLPVLRAGHHRRWRGVLHLRGREIAVETSRPMPINTDGEVTTRTPALFRVVPRALAVFAPPDAGEALKTRPEQEKSEQEGSMPSIFRSDAQVALDDVVVGCKRTAEHLADAAHLAENDAPELAELFRSLADERAAMAADLERHLLDMGTYPGEPDDDLEVFDQVVRRLRDLLNMHDRRLLLQERIEEEEDLASTVSRALQEDVPATTKETLKTVQARVAQGLRELRDARARLENTKE